MLCRTSTTTSAAITTTTCSRRARARERLDEELALIAHHDLAGFFLLHRDILELAREVAASSEAAPSTADTCASTEPVVAVTMRSSSSRDG